MHPGKPAAGWAISALVFALALAVGCGSESVDITDETPQRTPEEVEADYVQTDSAAKAAEDMEEKARLWFDFLDRNPDAPYNIGILDHLARQYYGEYLQDPTGAIAFLESHIPRMSGDQADFAAELLITLVGESGNVAKLRELAAKMEADGTLDHDNHLVFAEAALTAEAWDMAIKHATATVNGTTPEAIRAGSPDQVLNDARVTSWKNFYLGSALLIRGRAHMAKNNVDSALADFSAASTHERFNYVGVPRNDLNLHWAKALIAKGEYDAAMRRIAPDAIIQGHEPSMEIFRDAYEKSGGDAAGLERTVKKMHIELARAMPEFEAYDYEGEKVAWSDLKGRVTFLSFWYPRCAPCRKEFPELEKLFNKYKDRGFQVVAIDGRRMTEQSRKFIEEFKLTFTFLETGEGEEDVVRNLFGISTYPSAFIIGREGKIRYFRVGFKPGDEAKIEKEILSLLEE